MLNKELLKNIVIGTHMHQAAQLSALITVT